MADQQIYQQAFNYFDRNEDGVITTQDLILILKKLGHSPTPAEVESVLRSVSPNGNLSFADFQKLLASLESDDGYLRQSFKALDRDGNGLISATDLRSALRQLDEDLSPEDIENMIREADSDKDGQVSFEDFKKVVGGPLPTEKLMTQSSFRG